MPLLTELVMESQRRIPNRPTSRRGGSPISVTQISPCPFGTYLNVHGMDPFTKEEPEPKDKLRMKDGHWQERQIVEDLMFAGFELKYTLDDQLSVEVGEAQVPGHPDGIIVLSAHEEMLEIKAMDVWRWSQCKSYGIARAEPHIRCQIQSYMHSSDFRERNIEKTRIYTKHKDTCLPWDYEEPYDPRYIEPIIDIVDRIILDGFVPKKVGWELCGKCGHRFFCWEADEVLDLRGIDTEFGMQEIVDTWRKGKAYVDAGSTMVDEARAVLIPRLGELDVLMVEDLKVQRIKQHRTSITSQSYLGVHGDSQLGDVLTDSQYDQIKVTDTSAKKPKKTKKASS